LPPCGLSARHSTPQDLKSEEAPASASKVAEPPYTEDYVPSWSGQSYFGSKQQTAGNSTMPVQRIDYCRLLDHLAGTDRRDVLYRDLLLALAAVVIQRACGLSVVGSTCCVRFRQGSPKPRPHPCLGIVSKRLGSRYSSAARATAELSRPTLGCWRSEALELRAANRGGNP
jgi:hypothetical protein